MVIADEAGDVEFSSFSYRKYEDNDNDNTRITGSNDDDMYLNPISYHEGMNKIKQSNYPKIVATDTDDALQGSGISCNSGMPCGPSNGVICVNKLSKPLIKIGKGGASANLVNAIVGASIIGLPYALKQCGLVAGIALYILVAWLTDKSLRMLVGLASFHPLLKYRDVRTFEDLALYPFGELGSNIIMINMFVIAYGAMVEYLIIIKDTIPSIFGVEAPLQKALIMTATSFTIMLPLSMQRDMASLTITSIFSVMADIVLVGFIVMFSPIQESVENAGGWKEVLLEDAVNPSLFIGIGIISYSMSCQHAAFIVSGSLRRMTMTRWAKVTGFSITISAILCLLFGVCGYLGFLDETQGDVLNNFDTDSTLANIARFLLAITMFFTYPMESFVCRHVAIQLVHDGDMDGRDDPISEDEVKEAAGFLCWNRRQTWTIAIYLLTLLPALLVDDLGNVLSLNGCLGGCSIGEFRIRHYFDWETFYLLLCYF